MPVPHLSIDSTVVHALLKPRHAEFVLAQRLAARARDGRVRLVIANQANRMDIPHDPLAAEVRQLMRDGVLHMADQVARVGPETRLGPDLKIQNLNGSPWDAWDAVATDWKTHSDGACPGEGDRWQVESYWTCGADLFLTRDTSLLVMCRRMRDEHGIALEAVTLAEYMRKPVRSS